MNIKRQHLYNPLFFVSLSCLGLNVAWPDWHEPVSKFGIYDGYGGYGGYGGGPVDIPTLNEWSLLLLFFALAATGFIGLRYRSRST